MVSIAQLSNYFACLTQSSSYGPWILNLRAFDHILLIVGYFINCMSFSILQNQSPYSIDF